MKGYWTNFFLVVHTYKTAALKNCDTSLKLFNWQYSLALFKLVTDLLYDLSELSEVRTEVAEGGRSRRGLVSGDKPEGEE